MTRPRVPLCQSGAATPDRAHPGRRAKMLIAVFVVALVVPLSLSSLRTFRYEQWVSATDAAAERWVAGSDWRVEGVKQVGGDIVAAVIGHGDPPPIEAFRTDVRRSVPERVDIVVVEDRDGRSNCSLAAASAGRPFHTQEPRV
ncbi:MAG TPA: hypothetical protein VJ787_13050 [Thermoleophilia bacterium]|nr:hypothetical protein [Thermoleophilia bacterium]